MKIAVEVFFTFSCVLFCLVLSCFVLFCCCAGVYAHTAERSWECDADVKLDCDVNAVDDIAMQLVYGPIGKHLKVIFGGGRYNFISETEQDEEGNLVFTECNAVRCCNKHLIHVTFSALSVILGNAGKRTDGKNLINEWLDKQNEDEIRTYVWNKVRF